MPPAWDHPQSVIVLSPAGGEWDGYRLIRGDLQSLARRGTSLLVVGDRVNPFVPGGVRRWRIAVAFGSEEEAKAAEALILGDSRAEVLISGIVGLAGTTGETLETWGTPILDDLVDSDRLTRVSPQGAKRVLYSVT